MIRRGLAAACLTLFAALTLPDAGASAALWASRCSGCHGALPSGARANAADAPALLLAAFNTVAAMNSLAGSITSAERTSLADYIESIINTSPVTLLPAHDAAVTQPLGGRVFLGTQGSNLTTLVTGTAPTKGTVSYTTSAPSFTYDASPCVTGSDSFTYRAQDAANTIFTSFRQVNVTIGAFPVPVISSALSHSSPLDTPAEPYTIAAANFPCPALTTFGATGLPPGITLSGAVLSGTPSVAGDYTVTLTATNASGTGSMELRYSVGRLNQIITFPPQDMNPRPYSSTPFAVSPLATGGGSGNPIIYSSGSPGVCTVSADGLTVMPLQAGNCVIWANQGGNAEYAPAAQTTLVVVITAFPADAPTNLNVLVGDRTVRVSFTPPTSTGGLPILLYRARCGNFFFVANDSPTLPVLLTLSNFGVYSCSGTVITAFGEGLYPPGIGVFIPTPLPPDGDADGDGVPNGLEAGEGLNPLLMDNDIFTSARLFAMQQYRDFLGREGEPAGVQFYTDLIANGTVTREQAIEAFLAAPEFAAGMPSVIRLYLSFFDRTPDYAGLLLHVAALRQGTPLEVIAQNFSNSPEFTNTYGALTNDEYINLVYQNVLGRAPDPGGYDNYRTRLDSGALTRGQMMIGFSESLEFQALSDDTVWVISVYVGLLRPAPEVAGLDFYVDLLDNGTARGAVLPGFINATEYRRRFLP